MKYPHNLLPRRFLAGNNIPHLFLLKPQLQLVETFLYWIPLSHPIVVAPAGSLPLGLVSWWLTSEACDCHRPKETINQSDRTGHQSSSKFSPKISRHGRKNHLLSDPTLSRLLQVSLRHTAGFLGIHFHRLPRGGAARHGLDEVPCRLRTCQLDHHVG